MVEPGIELGAQVWAHNQYAAPAKGFAFQNFWRSHLQTTSTLWLQPQIVQCPHFSGKEPAASKREDTWWLITDTRRECSLNSHLPSRLACTAPSPARPSGQEWAQVGVKPAYPCPVLKWHRWSPPLCSARLTLTTAWTPLGRWREDHWFPRAATAGWAQLWLPSCSGGNDKKELTWLRDSDRDTRAWGGPKATGCSYSCTKPWVSSPGSWSLWKPRKLLPSWTPC